MKYKSCIWIAVASMIFLGCAASHPVVEIGGYYFDFEGNTYRIASINPASTVGYNILALKEGEHDVIVGLDKDQDGFLDGVVEEKISLRRAKVIYRAGIIEGEKLGRVKSRIMTQDYMTVINQYTYILTTYRLAVGDVYNKLSIVTAYYAPEEAVLWDLDADGKLDRIEKGDKSLEYYQSVYDQVIERGMVYGRIVRIEGRYQVVP